MKKKPKALAIPLDEMRLIFTIGRAGDPKKTKRAAERLLEKGWTKSEIAKAILALERLVDALSKRVRKKT